MPVKNLNSIGSVNGLSPVRHQTIVRTSAEYTRTHACAVYSHDAQVKTRASCEQSQKAC